MTNRTLTSKSKWNVLNRSGYWIEEIPVSYFGEGKMIVKEVLSSGVM